MVTHLEQMYNLLYALLPHNVSTNATSRHPRIVDALAPTRLNGTDVFADWEEPIFHGLLTQGAFGTAGGHNQTLYSTTAVDPILWGKMTAEITDVWTQTGWVYWTSGKTLSFGMRYGISGGGGSLVGIYIEASGLIRYSDNGGINSSGVSLPASGWYFLAYDHGNTTATKINVWLDGTQIVTDAGSVPAAGGKSVSYMWLQSEDGIFADIYYGSGLYVPIATEYALNLHCIPGRGTIQRDYKSEFYHLVVHAETATLLETLTATLLQYSSRNVGLGYEPSGTTGYPNWLEIFPIKALQFPNLFRKAFIIEARWK